MLVSSKVLKKASFWQRLSALLIDCFIIGILYSTPSLFFNFLRANEWIEFWLFYAYFIISERCFQATLGKMVVGIQVIRIDGQRPG